MKVAIVARHPKSRYLAPFNVPEWEIWTLSPFKNPNGSYTDLPRWNKFYELHDADYLEGEVAGAMEWLKAQNEERPGCVVLQEDIDVEDLVDQVGIDYFTNSIGYMLADALRKGAKEVALYGVDMAHDSEYAHQRPNVEYWIGRLAGSGAKVKVPDESDLVKHTRRYGFDRELPMEVNLKARASELQQRITNCEGAIEENLKNTASLLAVQGEIEGIKNVTNGSATVELNGYFDERTAAIRHGLEENHEKFQQLQQETLLLKGCLEENKYHRKLM